MLKMFADVMMCELNTFVPAVVPSEDHMPEFELKITLPACTNIVLRLTSAPRFFTLTVPATVPSDFQSSNAGVLKFDNPKYNASPTVAMSVYDSAKNAAPDLSFTVPATVPSVLQSSCSRMGDESTK